MRSNPDRVTLEMIRAGLESIALRMGITLVRNAKTYTLGESGDCSTAIFDFKGRCIAQSPQNPSHLLGIRHSVETALKQFSSDLHDQDVIIVNDPYAGGTHLPAMTMMMPIFCDGEPILFPAVRARLSDIGGPHPGGMYPLAHELYQEGDIIPPVRLAEAGRLRKGMDIMERLLKNNRIPDFYEADLNAMLASNKTGRAGITEMVDSWGAENIAEATEYVLDYTESLVRLEIEKWPDGTYEGRSYCDTDFRGCTDVLVNALVTIKGNQLKIDFAGSSPEVSGFINSPIANTKTYAIIPVLCSIEQAIPKNDGLFRAIEIVAPQGSALNPSFPAPVGLCPFHLGAQVSEAVARALAQAVPAKVGVSWANLPQILIEDQNPRGKPYPFFQSPLTIGGCGACYGHDGWGWPSPLGRLRLPSIEILERQSPFFVEQRELVVNSGGPGKWRGGLGTRVIFSVTGPSKLTAFTQGIKWPAAGFNGGKEGSPNALILKQNSPEKEEAGPLFYRRNMVAGDRICIEQGGGGGWGNPLERNPEQVKEDIIDEYITVEGAERNYGVIMNPVTLEVDDERTAARRREMSEMQEDKLCKLLTR